MQRARIISTLGSCGFYVSLFSSCAGEPTCPETWQAANETSTCDPPASVTRQAEQGLGTGIFGYALACEPTGEDDCGCPEDGLLEGGNFELEASDAKGVVARTVRVVVRSDSTFEIQLEPDVYYYPVGARLKGDHVDGGFTLSQGQVRFLRMLVGGC